MAPGHLYFLCLALVVIPPLPFSRTAAVIGLAWLPGQLSCLAGTNPRATDIVVSALAAAAAWYVAANDRDRAIGMLYLPTVAVHISAALGHTDAYSAWWLDFYLAMARIALLPATVDFEGLREVHRAFKQRREWDDMFWKRVLCWR